MDASGGRAAKNSLSIRPAAKNDLPAIMKIYDIAQDRMAANGNPDQWGKIYPSEAVIKEDIASERSFVVVSDAVHGVFALCEGEDPTYKTIDGAWLNDEPYGTIHRIAGDGSRHGLLKTAVAFAGSQVKNIRLDTHEKNISRPKAAEKLGFIRCGIIYVADANSDHEPRIAYQLLPEA